MWSAPTWPRAHAILVIKAFSRALCRDLYVPWSGPYSLFKFTNVVRYLEHVLSGCRASRARRSCFPVPSPLGSKEMLNHTRRLALVMAVVLVSAITTATSAPAAQTI